MTDPADGRAGIDAALVRRLVAAQFPQWRDLSVRPVEVDGWDNRTYRLGDELTVRLPTAAGYLPAVAKEDRWLPVLAPLLPLAIPVPVATGRPGCGYPFGWSVRRWLPGRPVRPDDDLVAFATTLSSFLLALQAVPVAGGPAAGAHSFYRGASLTHYDAETRAALAELAGVVDRAAALAVWEAAVTTTWNAPPVWFHGDVAGGNLLVRDGRLSAVIDFGTCGVGDPACDLVIAWTLLHGESRARFREAVAQDPGTWVQARGWALWKALIGLAADRSNAVNQRIVADVLADHERGQW